ncbi:MAG: hypothetical protein GX538_08170 [Gammaproteobacteria bacterium]|nr:hypothetical protein [Gammaproteobacteria bacterium]
MKIRYLVVTALAALLLGGCATYGYRGGSGDYYYGRSSGHYGAPYGSVGYGRYGGLYGSVGYGHPYGYSGYSYWPNRYYYGSWYPYYGYYGPYYRPPVVVRPRPDQDRPRESRPGAPWRNLSGVTRVEHRERPERVQAPTSGMRAQGQRERIQPTIRSNRQDVQRTRSSPWRAGSPAGNPGARSTAPVRQSAPPQRARPSASPAPQRAQPRERERGHVQER